MSEKITPEEKLLKIIEGTGAQEQKSLKHPVFSKRALKKDFFANTLGNIKQAVLDFKEKASLSFINKIVLLFCLVLSLIWAVDFIVQDKNLKNRFFFIKSSANKQVKDVLHEEKNPGDLSVFIESSRKRNIFSFVPPIEYVDAGVKKEDEYVQNLKLVGILWSSNPQAMIEDSVKQKTYLLFTEEEIGEFIVKKIYKDKVVLTDKEGKRELEIR